MTRMDGCVTRVNLDGRVVVVLKYFPLFSSSFCILKKENRRCEKKARI